jgi:hypothetical protein
MKTHLLLLGAALCPAAALAQPTTSDPGAPAPAQDQPPSTDTALEPAAPQAPNLIVTQPSPPPPPVVMTREPQYEVVQDNYNAPVFTTGALVFASAYGASVVTAALADDDDRGADRLYVPLVGPWLALDERSSCNVSDAGCDDETTAKVLLIADGVFQAAGAAAMVVGIFQPTSRRVVTRSAKLDKKIHVQPSFANAGVTVFGRW